MTRWKWIAYFKDGSRICQDEINPDTGRTWSTDHMDSSALKALVLEPQSGASRVVVQLREGEKLIRFWRHYKCTTNEQDTCWVVGIEKNGIKFYNFFNPDGSVVVSSDSEGSEFTI